MGIELTGIVISLIAALASAVTSLVKDATWLDNATQSLIGFVERKVKTPDEGESPNSVISQHLLNRLAEVQKFYKREKRNEGLSNFANALLVLGQYVIGAVLATTFTRENLDAFVAGLLGVSVVITTTLHQKFRPDLSAKISSNKASFLYSTIVAAQDEIEKIRKAHPKASTEEDIIDMLSRTLIKAHDNKEWIPVEIEKIKPVLEKPSA